MTLVLEVTISKRDAVIQEIQELKEKIASLEKEAEVSDKVARKLIDNARANLKQEGQLRFSVIDLHLRTHLPFEQINRVMEKLEKEGVVTDATDEFTKECLVSDHS